MTNRQPSNRNATPGYSARSGRLQQLELPLRERRIHLVRAIAGHPDPLRGGVVRHLARLVDVQHVGEDGEYPLKARLVRHEDRAIVGVPQQFQVERALVEVEGEEANRGTDIFGYFRRAATSAALSARRWWSAARPAVRCGLTTWRTKEAFRPVQNRDGSRMTFADWYHGWLGESERTAAEG